MTTAFHERQNSEDCSVHSLNNALGRVTITAEEVSGEIRKRIESYARALGEPPNSKRVLKYKKGLSKNNTFFSAESVWYAAAALGRVRVPHQVPYEEAVRGKYQKGNLIFLGKGVDGPHHAVGARGGMIYDSLNAGPAVPLTDENVKKIYKEVLGVFVFE